MSNYLDPTAGDWKYNPGYPGTHGDNGEPPEPGYPPHVVAHTDRGEIEIAHILTPIPDGYSFNSSSGEVEVVGNHDSNGHLFAASKELLEDLQFMLRHSKIAPHDLAFLRKKTIERKLIRLQFTLGDQPQKLRSITDIKH